MHNCMASRSLALGGLVERFSVCCEVRGFSLLITCTLYRYRYRLQFYTCYQSDTDTKKRPILPITDPIIGATLNINNHESQL